MTIDVMQYSKAGGCACKLPAGELSQILGGRGFGKFSDVGVVSLQQLRITRPTADMLVHSADYGSPVVPDPRLAGRVSACNAVSDIYASGGSVIAADILLELPRASHDRVLIGASMVAGVEEILRQEGAGSIGGHTTIGTELRIGCAVIGIAPAAEIRGHSGARVGDFLVLTKPIGNGLVFSGLKAGVLDMADCGAAIEIAATTNSRASELLTRLGCRTCTDVTGFGLVGAALEVAQASDVTIELMLGSVPLVPGAAAVLDQGIVPALAEETLFSHEAETVFPDPALALRDRLLAASPETSGGLLALLSPTAATSAVDELRRLGARVVGRVAARTEKPVRLRA